MDIRAAISTALEVERDAIEQVRSRVGERSEEAVRLLNACTGRVIVTGMGKAGLVGRKIAATFSSTGTPAHFMHPTEAVHGDLGMVTSHDVVLALSNSGETQELLGILPYLRALGVHIIALTGSADSSLARHSDVVIDVGVGREADPLGIVPTASTTAMLAMGDALAAALMAMRGFTRDDYALTHPGGSLGRSLLSRVEDLMIMEDHVPVAPSSITVREAVLIMSSKRLGAVFFTGADGRLEGILTDGDLRRLFSKHEEPLRAQAHEAMVRNPKRITPGVRAVEALRLMENHAITILPVVDEQERPVGALHMHDLVKAGLVLWRPLDT